MHEKLIEAKGKMIKVVDNFFTSLEKDVAELIEIE
jgi:hypothetical protein